MGKAKPLPKPPQKMSSEAQSEKEQGSRKVARDDNEEFEFFHEFQREKVKTLIHLMTSELKNNGINTEYLFLPFRPEQTNDKLLTFLNSIFPLGNGQPVAEEKIPRILAKTDPWTLFQCLKYIWCRLPKGEIIGWKAYNEFKKKEAEQEYSQKSFLEIMPKCLNSPNHASIVYDFFDLIVTMASNSRKNKMSARKIAKMCAVWAFQERGEPATDMDFTSKKTDINHFQQGLDEWIPASEAMFHLLLAFIRSFVPADSTKIKLPKSLRTILFDNDYPPKSSLTLSSDTVLTVPIVTLETCKFSRKPWQLIERCNELMNFDEPEDFETKEDYALLKSLFKKKKNVEGISSKMSKESKRLMKCMSTKHSTFQAGWARRKNLSNAGSVEDTISISRVDIDDYFIWAWLSTLSYEQTSQKRKMFGRSLILEFEFDGFKKWLILEESDATLDEQFHNAVDQTDYVNTSEEIPFKDQFLQNTKNNEEPKRRSVEATSSTQPVSHNSSEAIKNNTVNYPVEEILKPLPEPRLVPRVVPNRNKSSELKRENPPITRQRPSPAPEEGNLTKVYAQQLPIKNRTSSHVNSSIYSGKPPISYSQENENLPHQRRAPLPQKSLSPISNDHSQQSSAPLFTSPYSKPDVGRPSVNANSVPYQPQYRNFSPTPINRSQGPSADVSTRQTSSAYDEASIRDSPVEIYGEQSTSLKQRVADELNSPSVNYSDVTNNRPSEAESSPSTDIENESDQISDLANLVDDMTLQLISADPGNAVDDLNSSVRTNQENFESLTMFEKYKRQSQEVTHEHTLNDSQISVVTPLNISTTSRHMNDEHLIKDLPTIPVVEGSSSTTIPDVQIPVGNQAYYSSPSRKRDTLSPVRHDNFQAVNMSPKRNSLDDNNSMLPAGKSNSSSPIRYGNERQSLSPSRNGQSPSPVRYQRPISPNRREGNGAPVVHMQGRYSPDKSRGERESPLNAYHGSDEFYENEQSLQQQQQYSGDPNYGRIYTQRDSNAKIVGDRQHGISDQYTNVYSREPEPSTYDSEQTSGLRAQSQRPGNLQNELFYQQSSSHAHTPSPPSVNPNDKRPTNRSASPGAPRGGDLYDDSARQAMPPNNMYPRQGGGPPLAQGSPNYDQRRMYPGPSNQGPRNNGQYSSGPSNHVSHNNGPSNNGHYSSIPPYNPGSYNPGSYNPGPPNNGQYSPVTPHNAGPYNTNQYNPSQPNPAVYNAGPQYNAQRYGQGPPGGQGPSVYSSPPHKQQIRPQGTVPSRYQNHHSPVPAQTAFAPQGPATNKLHGGNMTKKTNRKKLYADIRSGNFGV